MVERAALAIFKRFFELKFTLDPTGLTRRSPDAVVITPVLTVTKFASLTSSRFLLLKTTATAGLTEILTVESISGV